ncbi:hypothetical protein EZS27_000733 [termite gut metagenome]|uniref:Polysaccharide biosynthesis protein n=1 Tax=termite gut metagenome TaxID=433724 RepID=A0A5J4T098_9ZZZZ
MLKKIFLATKIYIVTHPRYDKALSWSKLIFITGAAQLVVQAVGFISGILVIRLLPVEEYALYTIANTMLGTMVILSDGGISTGVMAQGGKVWQDKQKLGAVLATGLDLRRKFAGWALVVSIPILAYLLLHNGANWIAIILITASLIPAFYASLSDSLLEIPVKLHQSITPLQRNQVEVGIGRLALTGITLFAFPWAFFAIIANGVPRIWGNVKLRKITDRFIDKEQTADAEVKKEIVKIVKRTLPGAIYFAFSGQISIWIISIFGHTSSIAQIGALSRVSMLLTVFSVSIGTLVIPRFARFNGSMKQVFKKYIHILCSVSLLMCGIFAMVYIFSSQILWLLGGNYAALHYELLLCILCACLRFVVDVAYSLYVSKGWILSPITNILSNIIPLIVGCFLFNISTLLGVLYLNIFMTVILLLLHTCYGGIKIFRS